MQDAALSAFRSQLKRKEEELVGLGGVHAAGARPPARWGASQP